MRCWELGEKPRVRTRALRKGCFSECSCCIIGFRVSLNATYSTPANWTNSTYPTWSTASHIDAGWLKYRETTSITPMHVQVIDWPQSMDQISRSSIMGRPIFITKFYQFLLTESTNLLKQAYHPTNTTYTKGLKLFSPFG